MTFDPTVDIRTLLALAGAAVAVLGAVAGWLYRKYGASVKDTLAALRRLPETIEHVDAILHEVGKNHGSSLRDAVDRIERGLAFQDLRAWALLQDMEHAILETDADGSLIRINRTYLRWTGRSPGEVVGEGWKNVIHSEDVQRVSRAWEEAVRDKRDLELNFRILHVSGRTIFIRAHCYLIRSGQKAMGWIANLYKLQPPGDESFVDDARVA